MKIRYDFVTNSSSSSYIILGREVTIKDISIVEGERYLCVGKELSDGYDMFELDEAMLKYIKKNKISRKHYFRFYKFYTYLNSEDCPKLTINSLKQFIKDEDEEFEIIEIEKDYHSSDSIEDLKYTYEDYD